MLQHVFYWHAITIVIVLEDEQCGVHSSETLTLCKNNMSEKYNREEGVLYV